MININAHIHKYIYKGSSKSSTPHPERRAMAEHLCYGNALSILIKL